MTIKTIPVTVDDVEYNIIQFGAEDGARIKHRLICLLKHIPNLGALLSGSDFKENDVLQLIVQSIGSFPENELINLIKSLLNNIRFASPEKRSNPRVRFEDFSVDELMTIYKLAFESIKANYGNFFLKLRDDNVLNTL